MSPESMVNPQRGGRLQTLFDLIQWTENLDPDGDSGR
jgi:hypothetical protein